LNEADAHAAVMFDSTQLPTGTTAEVKFTVTTDDGTYSHSYFVPVWNQFRGWSICDHGGTGAHWPNGTLAAGIWAIGYNVATQDHSGWTRNQFLNSLDLANYLVVTTHGTPATHQADSTENIHWADYESSRITQMGTGWPPYNSTNVPPINFFHLYACNTGDFNNFIRACYPYMNAYGGWLENQCLMTYKHYMQIGQIGYVAGLVSLVLAEGQTASAARNNMVKSRTVYASENLPEDWRLIEMGDVCIYGDQFTRVKHVYTADGSYSPGFSRPLP
ncbi:hypothetical protein QPK87_17345, partial [Kamptonema cortianum]|nr:hypothetical protein [Geitlerinema splendidum]MDK3158320.1 hypothetical protein [Kamptonema cortianum]